MQRALTTLLFRLTAVALAAGLVLAFAAASAEAANGPQYGSIGQYGEVWRGGGFDTCWYDAGHYDGKGKPQGTGQRCQQGESQPTPGEFIDPVGFAVDTQDPSTSDGTALYVLDRVSNLPGKVAATTWRLQKLDGHGTVLGSDEFTLPAQSSQAQSGVFNYEMQGLTVDSQSGVVYATVVAYCDNINYSGCSPPGVFSSSTEYVEEVVAWSTTPTAGGAGPVLGAPSCPVAKAPATTCPDVLSKPVTGFPSPGLVSSASQLSQGGPPEQGGSPQIVGPEGLALDVTGGGRYLALESEDTTVNGAGAGINQICVSGATCSACPSKLPPAGWLVCYQAHPAYGDIRLQWSAAELNGLPNDNGEATFNPAGISTVPATDPNGGALTVLLDEQGGVGAQVASNIDVVNVPADLQSGSSIQSSGATTSTATGAPQDYAAVVTSDFTPELQSGDPDSANGGPTPATQLAAPQVQALGNGLYAADFEPQPAGKADPGNPDRKPSIWTPLTPGIRLLQPQADLTLSNDPTTTANPPLTTLFDTLGNPTAGSACSLTDAMSAAAGAATAPSLAAGSGGAVWVLTRGIDSAAGGGRAGEGGRQLIELAPKAGSACPVPTGTFTLAAPGGAPHPAEVTVKVGDSVSFDVCPPSPPPPASPVVCPATGSPGIDYLGAAPSEYAWDFGDGTTATVVSSLNGSGVYPWPSPTISHQYTSAGTFPVALNVYGDFGVYVETGTVHVTAGSTPTASFTWSQPSSPALTIAVDGSGSTPTAGNTILDYKWTWGDGQIDETSSPTDTHTYAAAGSYTVTLEVLDSADGHSAPQAETVTVAPPPPPPPTTSTTTTTPTQTPPPSPPAMIVTVERRLRSSHRLIVNLTCPAGQTGCNGTVVLRTAHAVTPPQRHGHHSHHRHTIFTLGLSRFNLGGGQGTTLQIRLSKTALELLLAHPLSVVAVVSAHNPQGESWAGDIAQRVKPALARARHHHAKKRH